MERTLPENANLEHLKAQAKDLLSDLRKDTPNYPLHAAQLQLAREYGFASWPKMVAHVEALEATKLDRAGQIDLVEKSIHDGKPADALRALVARDPLIRRASVAAAMATLDLDYDLDPDAVNVPTGGFNATPLVYVCFSAFAKEQPEAYAAMVRRLLDIGADPNALFNMDDYPDNPFSCLYGASGWARNAAATQMLLEAGADPDDNESLYHATETLDNSCLKLLLEAKPKKDHHYALLRKLDFEDMDGLNLMLSHGCDPNKFNALAHAIRRGRSAAIIRRLVEAGANVDKPNEDGLSVQQMVYERGLDLPELLERFVPDEADRLLRACWAGDAAEAAKHRLDTTTLPRLRRRAFTDAMWEGRAETVDAFVAGGFTWEDRDDSKGTPLHVACFQGSLPCVQALLEHNPPLNDHLDMYDAIPLQWACHASQFHDGHTDRDYPGIVRTMTAAGSPPPYRLMGSDAVQRALQEFWPELPAGTS